MKIYLVVDKDGYEWGFDNLETKQNEKVMSTVLKSHNDDPSLEIHKPFRLIEFEEVKK